MEFISKRNDVIGVIMKNMDKETVKIILLSVAGSGIAVFVISSALILFYKMFSDYFAEKNPMRYFLPLPPISVAAYIIAYNILKENQDISTTSLWTIIKNIASITFVSAGALFAFSVFIVILVEGGRKIL